MDRAYANALKRKQDLASELAEVDTFLKLYARFQGDGAAESAGIEGEQQADASASAGQNITRNRLKKFSHAARKRAYGGRGTPPVLVADAAVEAILSAGHPLEREELVEVVEAKGYTIASTDKPSYINIIMLRHAGDRAVKIGGKWGAPDMESQANTEHEQPKMEEPLGPSFPGMTSQDKLFQGPPLPHDTDRH
ncbi:hypothetical protein [Methylobacterium sp. Leaf113]|uniref:hypothetical protein n=1 Tax=Methylobacterium sp. Leaf113 TaxID=1736259 RepID=UPI000ABAD939|nr:hypothetical protein [Methylobacterium sp. Leaf113]